MGWDARPTIDPRVRRRQRLRNALQGVTLLGGMVLVFAVIATLFFGRTGLLTVVVTGIVLALVRPRVPTAWVLRMYGAHPLPAHAEIGRASCREGGVGRVGEGAVAGDGGRGAMRARAEVSTADV